MQEVEGKGGRRGDGNKRARTIPNIRRYITCRKWKEKEAGEEMATPEAITVKGEQTGHYLDRAEKERDTSKEGGKEGDRDGLGPSLSNVKTGERKPGRGMKQKMKGRRELRRKGNIGNC